MKFNELVNFVSVPDLKKRVEKFPLARKIPTRKAEMAALALNLSTSAESLSAYWETLNLYEKQALQESVHTHDGKAYEAFYLAKYKTEHPPFRDDYYNRSDSHSKRLSACFYPNRRNGGAKEIPDEILASLKKVVPEPEKYDVATLDTLPKATTPKILAKSYSCEMMVYVSSQQSEAEVHALLNLVKQRAIKVSEKTGNPSKSQINTLLSVVKDYYPDDSKSEEHVMAGIKVHGWLQIFRSASWITEKGGVLQIKESKFTYGQATHEILFGLFKDWLAQSEQDELIRINQIKGQTGKGKKYLTEPTLRRQCVADTLAQCPTEKWIEVDEFLDLLVINNCYCPVSLAPEYLYICDAHYGQLYNNNLLWSRYNLCLLMEYIATLGIIDIAFDLPEYVRNDHEESWGSTEMAALSRYDGLQYIKLTALGAYLVEQTQNYTPSEVQQITTASVMADGRIHFKQPPQISETLFLSTYANQMTTDSWQLCVEKMISYLETGGDLDDLMAFITERDPQPFLPEEVETLFKKLQQNKQAVVSEGKALLLTCASKKIAKHIANMPELRSWCKLAGDQQLVIPVNKANLFRKTIHQAHYAMPVSKD